jgi:hypothetical protein
MGRLLLSTCALALAVGCAPSVVDMPFDSDGDGLMDLDEQEIGTDPFVDDSDGDGHLDGFEVDEGADPLDVEDYPYAGGYGIDRCLPRHPHRHGQRRGRRDGQLLPP